MHPPRKQLQNTTKNQHEFIQHIYHLTILQIKLTAEPTVKTEQHFSL